MTSIIKMNLQMNYSQHVTDLTTDYDISNDRFGFMIQHFRICARPFC